MLQNSFPPSRFPVKKCLHAQTLPLAVPHKGPFSAYYYVWSKSTIQPILFYQLWNFMLTIQRSIVKLSTLLRILSLYNWIFPTLWNWHARGSYDLMRTRCKSMRITHTREKSITQYLLDKPLKDVKNFKDLGVTISKDLSWDNHISITVNKANNLLGLIKRFVGTTKVNVFSTLYLSLVQPILKYAVPVWFLRILRPSCVNKSESPLQIVC